MNTKRAFVLLLVLLAATCLSCGSEHSAVETVRGGVLTDYNTTTVGKAFEGTFQNAKWSALETEKGAIVVQFDGTVLYSKIHSKYYPPYVTISWQNNPPDWTVSANSNDTCVAGFANTFATIRSRFDDARLHPREEELSIRKSVEESLAVANSKIEGCVKNTPVPVKFQFTLSADQKTFKLNYVDDAFGNDQDRALKFIYQ